MLPVPPVFWSSSPSPLKETFRTRGGGSLPPPPHSVEGSIKQERSRSRPNMEPVDRATRPDAIMDPNTTRWDGVVVFHAARGDLGCPPKDETASPERTAMGCSLPLSDCPSPRAPLALYSPPVYLGSARSPPSFLTWMGFGWITFHVGRGKREKTKYKMTVFGWRSMAGSLVVVVVVGVRTYVRMYYCKIT